MVRSKLEVENEIKALSKERDDVVAEYKKKFKKLWVEYANSPDEVTKEDE